MNGLITMYLISGGIGMGVTPFDIAVSLVFAAFLIATSMFIFWLLIEASP
jgi:hypothetical protein